MTIVFEYYLKHAETILGLHEVIISMKACIRIFVNERRP